MSNYFNGKWCEPSRRSYWRPCCSAAAPLTAYGSPMTPAPAAGYWIAGGLAILAFLIPQSLMVADQWERAVVLRLGKLTAIRGPGMFAIVPFIDNVASWLDQRIQTTEINAEKALSKDTVPVNIDAVVFWQIHDPERAALEITNYRQAITQVAKPRCARSSAPHCCRRCCPNASRATSNCARRSDARRRMGRVGPLGRNPRYRRAAGAAGRDEPAGPGRSARNWPACCSDRPNRRSRRNSSRRPISMPAARRALQLRAMNIIYETTKERGATILMPTAMVDSMNPGVVGLVAATRRAAGWSLSAQSSYQRGALLHAAQELVRLRQAVREAAGVGAVAAPVGQFLGSSCSARGRRNPSRSSPALESNTATSDSLALVYFCKPHAAAARHLRHLVEREQHHLVVGADHRDRIARHGRDRAGLVRHRRR